VKKLALITALLLVIPLPSDTRPLPNIFLEATVDNNNPFVLQPIIYTVRLSYPSNVGIGGASFPPESPHFSITKIGEMARHTRQHGDRQHVVQELRFSVMFKNPGNFEIPAFRFVGGFDETGIGFFRDLNIRSASIPIMVRPAVKDIGTWLPANRLEFKYAYLPRGNQVRVGDLVRWVVIVKAWYLPAELIPDIVLPPIPGARMYSPRFETTNTDEAGGIVGEKRITINMVPEKAGNLVLPQMKLEWFDLINQVPRQIAIPQHTFRVLPAAPQKQREVLSQGAINDAPSARRFWLYVRNLTDWRAVSLAIAAAALFLAGVWGKRKYGHKFTMGPRRRAKTALEKLLASCDAGNAKAAAKGLINYCNIKGGGKATNIKQIGQEYPALKDEIARLDAALYGKSAQKWSGSALKALLQRDYVFEKKTAGADRDIPPLYPEG